MTFGLAEENQHPCACTAGLRSKCPGRNSWPSGPRWPKAPNYTLYVVLVMGLSAVSKSTQVCFE